MIKVKIAFENKDKDAEDTVISASFSAFDKIYPWLDKVKTLNEEKSLKKPAGFLHKGDNP